jgi:hypothetical protein
MLKLTNNQKRVLIGLCQLPMSSDTVIAEESEVKRSTFATVKKKLLEPPHSLISQLNVPNFQMLGAELITVGSSNLNQNMSINYDRTEVINRIHHFPNIISAFTDLKAGFVLVVSKNFTDLLIAHNAVASFYVEEGLTEFSDMLRSVVPLKPEGIFRFFEYGRLLSKYWGIPLVDGSSSNLNPNPPNNHPISSQISPLGWKIFNTMLDHPESSIMDLAKLLGNPRNTIARWARKFQRMNLYSTRFIPDLIKLGINVQLIASISVQGLDENRRLEIIRLVDDHFLPISLFCSYNEIVLFAIFPNYRSLRDTETQFFDEMNRRSLPFKINKKFLLPINNIIKPKTMKESFSPLVTYLRNSTKYSLEPYSKIT